MTFARNLVADLVEKRLWPIALALVVAIVAVPVALGGSNAEDPKPAPRALAAPAGARAAAAPADPAVTVSDPVPTKRRRSGPVRNPFEELRGGDDAPAAGTTATSGSAGTAVGTPAPGATSIPGSTTITGGVAPQPGTGTGSGGSGSGSGGSGKPDADSLDVYRVDLRFGKPGGLKVLRDVARLTPLPSADNPFFVFLGLLDDGETLVFLISSDVAATGDGKCRPSAKSCQTIEMQAGDTEFFDFTQEDGSVIQYQMDVLGVDRRDVTSAKAAAVSRARKSQVGQELLRMAAGDGKADAFNAYRFRPDRGVLVRAKRKATARGAAVRGTSGIVAGRWVRGTRPRTVTRKGEVAVWRTRPRAARRTG